MESEMREHAHMIAIGNWYDEDGFYDGEYEDVIPWTFSSDQGIGYDEAMALMKAWQAGPDVVINEHLYRTDVDDWYEYVVEAEGKFWHISISPNMGLDSITPYDSRDKALFVLMEPGSCCKGGHCRIGARGVVSS